MRVLLALLLLLVSMPAFASCDVPESSTGGNCTTGAEAYAVIKAKTDAARDYDKTHGFPAAISCVLRQVRGANTTAWIGNVHKYGGPCSEAVFWERRFTTGQDCPAGQTWLEETKTCHDPQQCLAKPNLSRGAIQGGTTLCHEGCTFEALGTSLGMGNITYADGWKASGAACTVGQPPKPNKPQECMPVAGQTVCLKENGEYCASASTGKQVCWKPGETGEKTTENVMQKRDAGPDAIPPANATLPSGDTLAQSGNPVTTTITKSAGPGGPVTNITTTTTNYVTSNGTNAGTGDSGEPSTGTGGGDDEGEGEGDEPGEPGEGVGELYEGSDKTVESVMSAFMTQAQNTQLIGVAMAFMGNCTFGGSCPAWSYDGGEMMGQLSFDLCGDVLAQIFVYCGYFMVALGAFHGFRIGFY